MKFSAEPVAEGVKITAVMEVDISKIKSAVLLRLISEIRNDQATDTTRCFDRIHNRHNRSGSPY